MPSGLVTFVFTDIEASTRLFRALGDGYPAVLERHNELLREAWHRHLGVEVKTEGDAFFVAFESAADAMAACVDAQRALAVEVWGDGVQVRARMGVHTGLAAPKDGDYIAYAVHQAARVVGAAHGGQVLASPDAVDAAGEVTGIEFVRLGRFRLRDFDEPTDLFQVAGGPVQVEFPAVRAIPAEGHNLAGPQDSFVGRDTDLAGVVELLEQCRLVSMVGPGGVGKTRLAIEVGLHVAANNRDGVWLVDLSSVTDGSQVAAAVADALGVSTAGTGAVEAVTDHLAGAEALVVFDNCEHLLDFAAGLISEVLERCAEVTVLATSREPLALAAEAVWRLGPLHESAIELFVDRARRADARFALDAENREVVAAICDRVDGLPLAVELAAARIDKLTPEGILAGLDDKFRLLRSRRRDLDERQRSLHTLLDWSYDLLNESEQAALRRLAVYADSFSIEGAEAAAGWGTVDECDVAETVWTLVDKSLVVPDTSDNESRYRLLATIRTYGRERLEAAGEATEAWQRTGAWLASRLGPQSDRDPSWLRNTHVEADSIRAAVNALTDIDVRLGQKLACSLAMLHDADGTYREGIPEIADYIQRLRAPSSDRCALLGQFAFMQTQRRLPIDPEVLVEAQQLVALGTTEPDWCRGRLATAVALSAYESGDPGHALQMAEQALNGDLLTHERARWLSLLGMACADLGALDRAVGAWREELGLHVELGDPKFISTVEGNLAEAFLRLGNRREAAQHQLSALEVGVQWGMAQVVAFALIVSARICAAENRWADAVLLHTVADDILDDLALPLHDQDRQLSDDMLLEAESHLDEIELESLTSRGRDFELPEAISAARSILEPLKDGARAPTLA
ncbi:MAG: adenylate/guanylate cyclase domain-containing protein [Acidimicrobiia bacterium]|nr:adenylate/guanylate cyclase domain-containing protein [Acidimicrobiia bacterium]